MKQRTMQEIADFFECTLAKDKLFMGQCWLYPEEKPDINREKKYWSAPAIMFPKQLISDAATHDWTVLVEPQKKE